MQKKKKTSNRKKTILWVILPGAVVLLGIALTLWLSLGRNPAETPDTPTVTTPPDQQSDEQITEPLFTEREELSINLGYGLQIREVGCYTGAFVEDGSDEFVSSVLMLRVINAGTQDIQFGQIKMAVPGGEALFELSSLPVGASMVLLEKNRMPWQTDREYEFAVLENAVLFETPMSLLPEQLELQLLDGGLNVRNISGADITGDVIIYYKNAQEGLYYGGITYRARIQGGLKEGELRQLMGSHFRGENTELMFVTIG